MIVAGLAPLRNSPMVPSSLLLGIPARAGMTPALLPSVILGCVWTFNMFNIIYLVSGGEPGGATDILVSEAYRWAFQRNEQYGFAAAYSVLIFFVLLGWTRLTRKLSGPEAA